MEDCSRALNAPARGPSWSTGHSMGPTAVVQRPQPILSSQKQRPRSRNPSTCTAPVMDALGCGIDSTERRHTTHWTHRQKPVNAWVHRALPAEAEATSSAISAGAQAPVWMLRLWTLGGCWEMPAHQMADGWPFAVNPGYTGALPSAAKRLVLYTMTGLSGLGSEAVAQEHLDLLCCSVVR